MSNSKKAGFCKSIFLKNSALCSLDPESEPYPEPEQRHFQCRNRNRDKSLRFHNTGL